MSCSAIQFQKGLSLPEFQGLYGTEEQCVALGLLRSSSCSGESPLAPTGTSVSVAKVKSMGLSMAGGSSAISAVPAAIRALSQPG